MSNANCAKCRQNILLGINVAVSFKSMYYSFIVFKEVCVIHSEGILYITFNFELMRLDRMLYLSYQDLS